MLSYTPSKLFESSFWRLPKMLLKSPDCNAGSFCSGLLDVNWDQLLQGKFGEDGTVFAFLIVLAVKTINVKRSFAIDPQLGSSDVLIILHIVQGHQINFES